MHNCAIIQSNNDQNGTMVAIVDRSARVHWLAPLAERPAQSSADVYAYSGEPESMRESMPRLSLSARVLPERGTVHIDIGNTCTWTPMPRTSSARMSSSQRNRGETSASDRPRNKQWKSDTIMIHCDGLAVSISLLGVPLRNTAMSPTTSTDGLSASSGCNGQLK